MQTLSSSDVPSLGRLQQRALIVGVIGLIAGGIGAAMNLDQFFMSWLIGFLFCLSLSLGCLALLMLGSMATGCGTKASIRSSASIPENSN